MESQEVNRKNKFSSTILVIIILSSLFGGAIVGYFLNNMSISNQIKDLENELSTINQRIDNLQTTSNIPLVLDDNVSLPLLFDQVRKSVVVVEGLIPHRDFFGRIYYTQDQGSGFIYNFNGQMIILTNYHVVADTTSINVTFINEKEYPASILGSNPSADLAILSADVSDDEFNPLEIVSSSALRVGDSVIVVGTPYGLEGTMSVGIVSALNRTLLTEDYSIGNVIQTTAPLNPGNSGGPLLNYQGQVVGIVTAIVQESEGIGFAIASDTILKNIEEIL
ncbi:MAG: S1C family serine protease [Candidatus Bathyarchaeota archaeon]